MRRCLRLSAASQILSTAPLSSACIETITSLHIVSARSAHTPAVLSPAKAHAVADGSRAVAMLLTGVHGCRSGLAIAHSTLRMQSSRILWNLHVFAHVRGAGTAMPSKQAMGEQFLELQRLCGQALYSHLAPAARARARAAGVGAVAICSTGQWRGNRVGGKQAAQRSRR